MVKSSIFNGTIIEGALRKAQMLAHGKYGLAPTDLLNILSDCVREKAVEDFENSKEQYYETRPIVSRTNGKFAAGPGSYEASSNILTITMNPGGSVADIGKIATFFDSTTTPNRAFPGIIVAFSASPDRYQIVPMFNTPDLASVINVTVLDWLIGDANSIRILQPHEIMSPENMTIFDVMNSQVIDLVDYEKFDRMRKMPIHNASERRWARYRKTSIDLAAGSNAPPLGTVTLSAYWVPPRSVRYDTYAYIGDTLVPAVEDLMMRKLLAIKTGQPIAETNIERAKYSQKQFEDSTTVEAQEKVR